MVLQTESKSQFTDLSVCCCCLAKMASIRSALLWKISISPTVWLDNLSNCQSWNITPPHNVFWRTDGYQGQFNDWTSLLRTFFVPCHFKDLLRSNILTWNDGLRLQNGIIHLRFWNRWSRTDWESLKTVPWRAQVVSVARDKRQFPTGLLLVVATQLYEMARPYVEIVEKSLKSYQKSSVFTNFDIIGRDCRIPNLNLWSCAALFP